MAVETVLVGGGKMGGALLGGWLAAGTPAGSLGVVEADADRRSALVDAHPGVAVAAAAADLGLAEPFQAVVAVKPADVAAACRALAATGRGPRRVLSIAAGVTTATVAVHLPAAAVLRAMPNTPALLGAGAAALAAGPGADEGALVWAEGLLGAVGSVHRVAEALLDAVTGLSGSGPAYVFLVAEAMTDAGVLAGLPRPVAAALTAQTILGAARMLVETGDGPEALRAAVTSPGGTTAAGLRVLEASAVRAAFLDAVAAAAERSRQLAG